jgi:hypothetical protein
MSEPIFHPTVHNSPMVDWDLMLRIPVCGIGFMF